MLHRKFTSVFVLHCICHGLEKGESWKNVGVAAAKKRDEISHYIEGNEKVWLNIDSSYLYASVRWPQTRGLIIFQIFHSTVTIIMC
jgi:hypothetical protein